MSKLYVGSICYTDLVAAMKAAHSSGTRTKNGKVYTNVALWVNEEEDKFGNIGSISLSEPKDSTAKKTYIGNFKEVIKGGGVPLEATPSGKDDEDDLPF